MAVFEKRKTSKGQTRWRAVVRKDGIIKRKTFTIKADAVEWARQTESAIALGDAHIRLPRATRRTLADLIDHYMKTVMPLKPKSRETREPQLLWWRERLGREGLDRIKPGVISEIRDELLQCKSRLGKPFAPATVNRYLAAISHVFSHGQKMEWVDRNPVKAVPKLSEPRGRTRFLSEGEKDRLLEACQASSNPYVYHVVLLALSTGMRKGEILGLTWGDVDFERGRVVLTNTKNGEIRVVPLVGRVALELKAQRTSDASEQHLVFPQMKDERKPAHIRNAFEACLDEAGIEDFHFHDLRHTAASYLLMNGASLPEIAAVLGHKTLAMVQRYAHLSDAHTAGVVERMNAAFLG